MDIYQPAVRPLRKRNNHILPPDDISALLVFAILGLIRLTYDLSLLLNIVLFCVSGLDEEQHIDIIKNITGFLGEAVYLRCRYQGKDEIIGAQWKRQINSNVKKLAGFASNGVPYSFNDFEKPDSITNLTAKMIVSTVEAEGEYICEFETVGVYYSDIVFLTVLGKSSQ